MEIALNLIWLLLAVVIVRLWVRHAPLDGVGLRSQIGAVTLLIVILFPVISVTDDLQLAQNPAEDDTYTCLRRNSTLVSAHSIFPATSTFPASVLTEFPFVYLRYVATGRLPVGTPDNPALSAIQNRPPPVA